MEKGSEIEPAEGGILSSFRGERPAGGRQGNGPRAEKRGPVVGRHLSGG